MISILPILLSTFSFMPDGIVHVVQDNVAITVTLDPTEFTVGDPVTLTIEATTDKTMQISLNVSDVFGAFSINNETTLLDIPVNDGRQWTWLLQLDTFDASATEFSGISLEWTKPNGSSGYIHVDAIPIKIHSVAGDALHEMSLRDIRGSVPLLTTISWWPVFTAGAVLCFAFFMYVHWFCSRNTPPVPAHIKAMRDIEQLKTAGLDAQHFYTGLSSIVRTYIEDRFDIAATGQTTREFLIAEKENPRLEQCDRKALADFLIAADLVKFARFEPTTANWDEAIEHAIDFVSNTMKELNQKHVEVAA